MRYKIVYTHHFDKNFAKLDREIQKRIAQKIEYLTENPHLIKKARYAPKDLEGICKYRVGDWRVLFWTDYHQRVITLYDIDHRGGVYRNL